MEELAPVKSGRNTDGTFARGNGIGAAGRPKGSRNKATLAAETLLDGESELITRKAIEMALEGDTTALRLCMERLIAPQRDRPVRMGIPELKTAAQISMASETIVHHAAEGEITPHEANRLMALVEARRKIFETEELERRLDELERRVG